MPDYTLTTSPELKRRHARETRFKWYGRIAILLSIAFLIFMFTAIIIRGAGAFQQTQIALDVEFSEDVIDPTAQRDPNICLLYTSPSPRDQRGSRMPSSA